MNNYFLIKKTIFENKFFINFITFSVIAFPGFYKFAVVLIAANFFSEYIADWYSKVFLWLTLIISFTGVAIASLTVNKEIKITNENGVKMLFFSILILSVPLYIFEFNSYNYQEVLVVFICLFSLGLYEIYRQAFLNVANFVVVFNCAIISSILFISAVVLLILVESNNHLIYFCVAILSFTLPLICFFYSNKTIMHQEGDITNAKIKAYSKYSFSNVMSTSLSYMVPLALINELGENSSSFLTQIFLLSTFVYLIPRAISANQIPKMRVGLITSESVFSFFKKVNLFLLVCIIVAIPAFYFSLSEPYISILLFTSMLCSQISLPFANVLMVKSRGTEMLKVNVISISILIVFIFFCFLHISTGYDRALAILISFLCFQIIKSFLLYFHSKRYF